MIDFDTKDNAHIVYVMYGHDGSVLYVGKTNNFDTRWSAHKGKPGSVIDVDKIQDIVLHVMDSEPSCVFMEAQMILTLKPLWNKSRPWGEPSNHAIDPVLTVSYNQLQEQKRKAKEAFITERREALRIAAEREKEGLSIVDICKELGISESALNNYKAYIRRSEVYGNLTA